MTIHDSEIICSNLKEISFGSPDFKNRLKRIIESMRKMNSYIAIQLKKINFTNTDPINDFDLAELYTEVDYISDEYNKTNENKFLGIWGEANVFCVRLRLLGDTHNVWEEIS